MLKVLLLTGLLIAGMGTVVHAEDDIKCYKNSNGDIIYSNRKCPDGYSRVGVLIDLSSRSSEPQNAYTPIVPVESTVEAASVKEKTAPSKPKAEPIIYYDDKGQLTMVFNDGLSHGQQWGYFHQRYYGMYDCRPVYPCGCSNYSYRPRFNCY